MALGSLVDSPLQQNPLAGGGLGGALEAPAPTYDELQGDALVKQIQGRMMQQDVKSPAFNAFASEVIKTKGYPTKTIQEYNTLFPNNLLTQNPLFPNNLLTQNPLLGATMPSQEEGMPGASGSNTRLDPQADMPDALSSLAGINLIDPNKQEYKSDDPIMQGYYDSEFFKPNAPTTMDVVNYTYQGKPMQGSSSNISQFQQYLDSVGKGDLIQRDNQLNATDTGPLGPPIGLDGKPIGPGLQDLVSPATPPTPTIPKLDGTGLPEHNYTRSVQPIVTGPETFEVSTQQAPYQEQFTGFGNQLTGFGNQLTGFGDQFGGLDKQFDTINTRLNSMDEGIAGLSELLQPQQQLYNSPYSNFNFSSNSYSNPSPFGLGSLFGRRY